MKIVLHTGAHCTDDDRLLKCLLRNKEAFSKRGIAVPGPGRYRALLLDALRAMERAAPAPGARDVLIDAILDDEDADRMILSNPQFFGSYRSAFLDEMLYPMAEQRLTQIRRLFAGDDIEIAMALRNPASFLPALAEASTQPGALEKIARADPFDVRWSDLVLRLHQAAPDVKITLWCNEDTPLIWAQIIRALAGLQTGERITGGFDLLATLISGEGMQKFRAYLHQHRHLNDAQKHDIISTFLDRYAVADDLEEELDVPGWTAGVVDEMTRRYDNDVAQIASMPNVRLIAP